MRKISAPQIATAAAWLGVAALAAILATARYSEALAGGVGIDLNAWLGAAQQLRNGGDPYDAPGYTYTPLLAWLLIPLEGADKAMAAWTALSLLAGAAAIAFVVLAHRDMLPLWRAPLVAAIAVITLFYSRVLSTELYLGQNQLLVMALLAAAALAAVRWPVLSGVMIGLVALVKTWPAVIGLWLLRRGNRGRLRSVLAAIATVLAFAGIMAIALGPASIGRLVDRTVGLGEQLVPVYSVWYFARHWPAMDDTPVTFTAATLLSQTITVALLVGVLALIVLALLRPGTPSLALWNIAAATTLLIPVSHSFYRLLVVPLLWVWLAELLGRRPRIRSAIAVTALALWWVFAFRLEATLGTGWGQLAVVIATTAVIALSTLLASFVDAGPVAAWQQNRPRAAVSGPGGDSVASQTR